jgi:ribonuclease P protein component
MTERLLKRRDFVAVSDGLTWAVPSVVAQMAPQKIPHPNPRLGFTCTKKLGNAVARNRIRRRLKEAARLVAAPYLRAGNDYVLVGRQAALNRGFEELKKDIISALENIHTPGLQKRARAPRKNSKTS